MTTLPLPDDAIALMFESDPAALDDSTFTALIHEFRRRRNVFLSDEAAASLKAKKSRVAVQPSTPSLAAKLDKPASEVELDDLLG